MGRHQSILSICFLTLALASAGCGDGTPATAPAPTPSAPAFSKGSAKPHPRAPYIADLQLSSLEIRLSPTDEYTPYTVTVTNPSSKDYQSIYLKGELQTIDNPPVPVTAFLAYCPNSNGVVPRGDCTMSHGITPGLSSLTPGLATFTLRVLQKQPDGVTMKELDSKTVMVVLVL